MEGLVGYDSKFQVTNMSVEGDDQLEVHVDTVEGTAVVKNNFAEITFYIRLHFILQLEASVPLMKLVFCLL